MSKRIPKNSLLEPKRHHECDPASIEVIGLSSCHTPWICRTHKMEHDESFGISEVLGSMKGYVPNVYKYCTIQYHVYEEMDLACPSPSNFPM